MKELWVGSTDEIHLGIYYFVVIERYRGVRYSNLANLFDLSVTFPNNVRRDSCTVYDIDDCNCLDDILQKYPELLL